VAHWRGRQGDDEERHKKALTGKLWYTVGGGPCELDTGDLGLGSSRTRMTRAVDRRRLRRRDEHLRGGMDKG
jgi:hypothetical protein